MLSKGHIYALMAFGLWGVIPVFWKSIGHIDPWAILVFRVLGSGLCALCIRFSLSRELKSIRPVLSWAMGLQALLILTNWFVFVYAIQIEHVVDASVGYFLGPFFGIAFGIILRGERLTFWQKAAVAMALCGVVPLFFSQSSMPWISVVLASTFAYYGHLKKGHPVSPATSLYSEAVINIVPTLILVSLFSPPKAFEFTGGGDVLGVIATGPVTLIPLIFFSAAAKRIPLSTLNIFQFLAPLGQLSLGLFVYKEPFGPLHQSAFFFIAPAVGLYLWAGRKK